MKNLLFLPLLYFGSIYIHAQNKTPQQCIESFFEAFHKKDTVELRSMMHEDLVLRTVIKTNDGIASVKNEDVSTFLKSIASIPDNVVFLEKITEYKIEVDGQLAHVWTPYSFYANNQLSHAGVNSFVLVHVDGKWKIVHLIDTREKG